MSAQPATGTVLLGKYRVDGIMAEGGMGLITKAFHVELEQPVVIKILLPSLVSNASIVQRFLREAQAIVRLRGEHIARVLDVGKMPDGTPFMVMEYLDGADLGKILNYYGAQDPGVACDLIIQACEGLAEAHALGIVHRDIKPSNFFVTKRPDGTTLLKILDFGISSAPIGVDSELTRTQSVIGTPAYMAPEQMRSARASDPRSDLWGLGIVLYQALAGKRPWDADSYSELCLKVGMDATPPIDKPLPAGLEEIVRKCLEKSPDARYPNVADLAWALVPFASDPAYAAAGAERTARILGMAIPTPTGQLGTGPIRPRSFSRATGIPAGAVATPHSANGAVSLQSSVQTGGNKKWVLAVGAIAGGLLGAALVVLATGAGSAKQPAVADAATVLAVVGSSIDARPARSPDASKPRPIDARPSQPDAKSAPVSPDAISTRPGKRVPNRRPPEDKTTKPPKPPDVFGQRE